MKASHIGISTVVILSLAGCSSDGFGNKRIDYRTAAVQVPSLEVPPDLTAPGVDDRYKVPQGDGSTVATYSGYSGAAQGRTVTATVVLPEVKDVRLERNGAQRWLVVKDRPENVWNVVKAFLIENGLSIKTEDQAAGLMETEWSENRAKIPLDGIRKWLGKVIDSVYSSGERDQYRVRLERAKDGESTEVYISHRGMEEVQDASKNSYKWQARPNDPEMEAVMLQRLMVRFGGSETQAANALSGADAGVAAISASGASGTAALQQTSDGGEVIVVNDAFDRAWRRVGLAIERADFAVEDKDRAKGTYFLRPIKAESGWLDTLMFWRDDETAGKRYRVNVKDGGAACEVSVADQEGASDDVTKRILEAVYQNINE
jgi:outer membrane protein assembly factor BamC